MKTSLHPMFRWLPLLPVFIPRAHAGSAQWLAAPTTGYWNTAANWSPATVPSSLTDTAIFGASGLTSISFSADVPLGSLVFNNNAPAYALTIGPSRTLAFGGAGLVNYGATIQNFVVTASGANAGRIAFTGSSTAAANTRFTQNGITQAAGAYGTTIFSDTSSAGSASFLNKATSFQNGYGGYTLFYNSASAGSASITNEGGAGYGGVEFSNSSTAANAAFLNQAATIGNGNGGTVDFFDTSTAGNATFDNAASTVATARSGYTKFSHTTTAGTAKFYNRASASAVGGGGVTMVRDNCSADHATFENEGGAAGGRTLLYHSTKGGSALFRNKGTAVTNGQEGTTILYNSANAENAVFENEGGSFRSGSAYFYATSKAGTATVHNRGMATAGYGGVCNFLGSSSADQAVFDNEGAAADGGTGGYTNFTDHATAGSATFTSRASTKANATGGRTVFYGSSTAANATLTGLGATTSNVNWGAGTDFAAQSTAGNATVIANGGTNGGTGAFIRFFENSSGGTATMKVYGNASLEIGVHASPGVTIGSLEGSGFASLGANTLGIGGNNTSTTFSGVLYGTGGVTKTGSGTLTLTGANTYTGATQVAGGTLSISAAWIANGSDVKLSNGGILNLSYSGTDIIDELFIDGIRQVSGTWGSLSSTATHKTSRITGTGLLNVTTGVNPDPYIEWGYNGGLTAGTNDAKTADPDNDGRSNLNEFAFDGKPMSGASSGKMVSKVATFTISGSAVKALTLTVPVRGSSTTPAFTGATDLTATADGVIYHIQGGITLSTWTTSQVREMPVTEATALQTGLALPVLSPGWSYRSFYLVNSNPATTPKAFLRAWASQ
ncbi:autotransporter-associated beta strand repeat-containing protein [Luteolibacter ambystomatis]|uniref:Autotransporter-associated beta strand repeat-containing protein n=1 Tax=Luteolibacter ambystomatis TaxID=2824561 RepID=A0A975G7U7_9BACT|nr:autotransporter-associated beta strand repeat-containing protein [Luteolibacter ambystomatis]QUE50366.1 autotransporter-associated beta strand repeat-containing protein [Luteolibacter ambystomatis]